MAEEAQEHHHHHHHHSSSSHHNDSTHEYRKKAINGIQKRKNIAKWLYRTALIITILCVLMVMVVYTIL
jgi:type IV secretory pathway component VirB8